MRVKHIPGRLRAGAVHRIYTNIVFWLQGTAIPWSLCLFVKETHKPSREDTGDKADQQIPKDFRHGKPLLQKGAMAVLFF